MNLNCNGDELALIRNAYGSLCWLYALLPKEFWGPFFATALSLTVVRFLDDLGRKRDRRIKRYNDLVVIQREIEDNRIRLEVHQELLTNELTAPQTQTLLNTILPEMHLDQRSLIDDVHNTETKAMALDLYLGLELYKISTDSSLSAISENYERWFRRSDRDGFKTSEAKGATFTSLILSKDKQINLLLEKARGLHRKAALLREHISKLVESEKSEFGL